MANRLAGATSPYLQQHADNPVDWYEWEDAAFADARDRNVPILLSVGYSACHWCHVMAHESFEHDETASMMNERFVSVKVDREERPDVDAIYMDAVTAMTGHGGWPMTVFLTPDGSPFYAGTYFPRDRHPGMPAFRDVLVAVSDLWRQRPDEVHDQATTVVQRLEEMRAGVVIGQEAPPTDAEVSSALASLSKSYDYVGGGFGTAPKFPPSMVLEFLLRHHARTGSHDALLMAEATMRAMAAGGIYDQLSGGFARYAVDARWVVPHFEKMLYDNAQLASVALHLYRATGRPVGRRLAEETADFIVAELGTSEGGFASALDADSEGVEGRFYVWNRQQLESSLSSADAEWAADMFEVTEQGTFEDGSSTLQRLKEPDDLDRYQRVRRQLLEARAHRVRPARDDKVVASWNGMAIGALAEVGALLGRNDLVGAAGQAADLLLRVHWIDGRLRRVSRTGVAGEPAGVLDDYANVAAGLLTLYSVTGDERWFQSAGLLLDVVLAQFADDRGGFFDTAHDAEKLVRRPQDPGDNASPSGQAAAAGALLSYGALSGDLRYRDAAGAALAANARLLTASPRFAGWWLSVAEAWLDGPREVAVVGSPGTARDRLVEVALSGVAPGAVLAVGEPGAPSQVRLLADRTAMGSEPAAYVCRHFTCDTPTTDPAQLARLLGGVVAAGPVDPLAAK